MVTAVCHGGDTGCGGGAAVPSLTARDSSSWPRGATVLPLRAHIPFNGLSPYFTKHTCHQDDAQRPKGGGGSGLSPLLSPRVLTAATQRGECVSCRPRAVLRAHVACWPVWTSPLRPRSQARDLTLSSAGPSRLQLTAPPVASTVPNSALPLGLLLSGTTPLSSGPVFPGPHPA